jgi:hypothetical protein
MAISDFICMKLILIQLFHTRNEKKLKQFMWAYLPLWLGQLGLNILQIIITFKVPSLFLYLLFNIKLDVFWTYVIKFLKNRNSRIFLQFKGKMNISNTQTLRICLNKFDYRSILTVVRSFMCQHRGIYLAQNAWTRNSS